LSETSVAPPVSRTWIHHGQGNDCINVCKSARRPRLTSVCLARSLKFYYFQAQNRVSTDGYSVKSSSVLTIYVKTRVACVCQHSINVDAPLLPVVSQEIGETRRTGRQTQMRRVQRSCREHALPEGCNYAYKSSIYGAQPRSPSNLSRLMHRTHTTPLASDRSKEPDRGGVDMFPVSSLHNIADNNISQMMSSLMTSLA